MNALEDTLASSFQLDASKRLASEMFSPHLEHFRSGNDFVCKVMGVVGIEIKQMY